MACPTCELPRFCDCKEHDALCECKDCHLLAVKNKDIDCSPPCPTCSEKGLEGWEMAHGV